MRKKYIATKYDCLTQSLREQIEKELIKARKHHEYEKKMKERSRVSTNLSRTWSARGNQSKYDVEREETRKRAADMKKYFEDKYATMPTEENPRKDSTSKDGTG